RPRGPEILPPEYRRVGGEANATEETLTPIYPLTEGVQQGRLRQLTGMALRELSQRAVRDWIPPAVLQPLNLPPLRAALDFVHRPPPDADTDLLASGRHPMQRRLAFEELLAHQLSLRLLRREIQRAPGWAFAPGGAQSVVARFADSLPFELTRAQLRAWQEIERDLAQSSPMLRLVSGDVRCGKEGGAAA